MKKLIIITSFLLSITTIKAQNATQDAKGNYIAIKTANTATDSTKATGKTFTDTRGIVFPVMVSAKGKLFYMRTSKSGTQYKAYIKVN